MKIGFVGLGAMGRPMASRLLGAGHETSVWNRSPEKADALVEAGARRADSPADAATGAEIVFSMLTDDDAVEAVAFGPDGIAAGLAPGAIHASSSTISVALSRSLAERHEGRGQAYIAANVLGRPPAAQKGELYVMAAGRAEDVASAKPAFDAIGQKTFVIGEAAWQANLVKLCANFLIFSTIEQLSEVFAICAKGDVEAGTVFDVLSNTFFSAPVHINYGRLIVDKAFSPPGAPMAIGKKDNDLLLAAGEAFGAALPMASLLRDRFITSLARGDADLDFAALSRRAREDAGLD